MFNDFRLLVEILVAKRLNISSYIGLLRHAIMFENNKSSFNSIAEIQELLINQGLIVDVIPQTLFDSGVITHTEYGALKII